MNTVRRLYFLGILATLAIFALTETSASIEQATKSTKAYSRAKVLDGKTKSGAQQSTQLEPVDGRNNSKDVDAKSKPILKKYKVVRLYNIHSTVDEGDESRVNRDYESRAKRNATVYNDVELKDAKKSRSSKKLKLARTRAGWKNWKNNKERTGDLNGVERVEEKEKRRANVDRGEAGYLIDDNGQTSRFRRYAVTRSSKDDRLDYYAQRKAVMDRYYARQKAIAEKYARRISTTPRYIYQYNFYPQTDKNNSLPLDIKSETNRANVSSSIKTEANENTLTPFNKTEAVENTGTRFIKAGTDYANKIGNAASGTADNEILVDSSTSASSTFSTTETEKQALETTTQSSPDSRSNQIQFVENSLEDNLDEEASNDYDYYTLEDKSKTSSETTSDNYGAQNDSEWTTDDSGNETLKLGACSGKLVYQHNLNIGVHETTSTEVDLSTSLQGNFCVTCIRVEPVQKNKATIHWNISRKEDGSFSMVKLRFKGSQDDRVSYVVKMWAIDRENDRCDHVQK